MGTACSVSSLDRTVLVGFRGPGAEEKGNSKFKPWVPPAWNSCVLILSQVGGCLLMSWSLPSVSWQWILVPYWIPRKTTVKTPTLTYTRMATKAQWFTLTAGRSSNRLPVGDYCSEEFRLVRFHCTQYSVMAKKGLPSSSLTLMNRSNLSQFHKQLLLKSCLSNANLFFPLLQSMRQLQPLHINRVFWRTRKLCSLMKNVILLISLFFKVLVLIFCV